MQVEPLRAADVDDVAALWAELEGNPDHAALDAAATDDGAAATVAHDGGGVAGYALAVETTPADVCSAVAATAPVRR